MSTKKVEFSCLWCHAGCIVCELLTSTAMLQRITTLAYSYYFVGQSIASADKNNHSMFICPLGPDGPGCLFQFIFGILRKVSRRKTFRYSNTHTGSFGVCINDCFPPKLPMLKFSSRMIELLLTLGGQFEQRHHQSLFAHSSSESGWSSLAVSSNAAAVSASLHRISTAVYWLDTVYDWMLESAKALYNVASSIVCNTS